MKRWPIALVGIAIAGLLGAGIVRSISNNKASQQALQERTQDLQKATTLSIRPNDLIAVQELELHLTQDIAGAVKAASSAMVKARVSGELQGLQVREGDSVQAGQVIARVVSTEYAARLAQTEQQAQAAQAQVTIAQRNLDNNKALVGQGFISATALQTSQSNLQAAQASYAAAQAAVEAARQAVNDSVLRAPISGQVAQRLAQVGERVAPDARIVEIVDLSRLELEASIDPAQSLRIRPGQTATLTVEGSDTPIQSKVLRINPSAQAGSRAVLAYLSLPSNAGLRQGLYVQGQLQVGLAKGLAVPLDSVRTDKPKPYVQLVQSANGQMQVLQQEVVVQAQGNAQGKPYAIVQGLAPDSKVLTGSIGVIRPGTPAQIAQGGQ